MSIICSTVVISLWRASFFTDCFLKNSLFMAIIIVRLFLLSNLDFPKSLVQLLSAANTTIRARVRNGWDSRPSRTTAHAELISQNVGPLSVCNEFHTFAIQKLTIAEVHTKVINCKSASKSCLLQFVHTKGIPAMTFWYTNWLTNRFCEQ